MRITYVGHATLLLEIAGRRILTDPNFDPSLGRFLRRVSAPGILVGALPRLDALLLSHAHADHLSFASLDALPRDIPLFAPPAVERWLRRLGYTHAVALAPGEEARLGPSRGPDAPGEVIIRAASAKHLGSRYGVDRWRSAANMYLIDAAGHTCFFAGDTGLSADSDRMVREHVIATGRRLDVALLPIGHAPWWKPRFRYGHLSSDDALTLFERLNARYFIPYHWGTFNHVTAGAHDGIRVLRSRLETHARRDHVKVIEPGTAFELPLGDA